MAALAYCFSGPVLIGNRHQSYFLIAGIGETSDVAHDLTTDVVVTESDRESGILSVIDSHNATGEKQRHQQCRPNQRGNDSELSSAQRKHDCSLS